MEKDNHKYKYKYIGTNSRLDTIQAGILIEKLKIFENEIYLRETIASQYQEALNGKVLFQNTSKFKKSAWAQFTINLKNNDIRETIITKLGLKKIPTNIYYPIPLHSQQAYMHFPKAKWFACK